MTKKPNFTKLKKIRLVISDVDGVLTDGSIYYSEKGEFLKKFNTKDGMAVELLLKNKIFTILITKENSLAVKHRAKKIKVRKTYLGTNTKESKLSEICKKFKVTTNEIAYIGDDVNDIEIMKKVGLSVAPNDGIKQVKKIADYICVSNGGEGVLREVADLIIASKQKKN